MISEKLLEHVNHTFGWHGGIGDPPSENAVKAIVRGTLEFVEDQISELFKNKKKI